MYMVGSMRFEVEADEDDEIARESEKMGEGKKDN
jgi:hypothetical protein